MHPVVFDSGLLSVLPDTHVSEGGFACELHAVYEDVNARLVRDDLAGRAFQAGSALLLGYKEIIHHRRII